MELWSKIIRIIRPLFCSTKLLYLYIILRSNDGFIFFYFSRRYESKPTRLFPAISRSTIYIISISKLYIPHNKSRFFPHIIFHWSVPYYVYFSLNSLKYILHYVIINMCTLQYYYNERWVFFKRQRFYSEDDQGDGIHIID